MTVEREHRCRAGNRWRVAGTEPDLAEVLAEPMVHLLMQRDGVSRCALARVLATARAALRRGLCLDLAA
jgi:hypothetical protein